jgi:hypothetical protein
VIAPVRGWTFENEVLTTATTEFLSNGDRFEMVADDQSAIEGDKWTVLSRILNGEETYYRWYEFEDAVNAYQESIQMFIVDAPAAQQELLTPYMASVESGYRVDMAKQKDISYKMKVLIIVFQLVGFGLAMIIFSFYPITRARSEEVRRKLDERKAAAEATE